MMKQFEVLGDRMLAWLMPGAQATATSILTCGQVPCGYCGPVSLPCYRTCCDNPGHPPSCGSCRCPCGVG